VSNIDQNSKFIAPLQEKMDKQGGLTLSRLSHTFRAKEELLHYEIQGLLSNPPVAV